jgi:voltage-gated potassium channel
MSESPTATESPTGKDSLKKRIHAVIFEADTTAGAVFDVVLLIAILLSVVVISLESVPEIRSAYGELLTDLKWIFTGIFTVEYLLRIYCVKKPLRYIFSFWGIIDLLAFLPDYLLFFSKADAHGFAVIRSLRLIRVFRILKLSWIHSEAESLGDAIWRARGKVIVFLTVVLILVTVTGTLMYEIENAMSDRSKFESIPDGIYWAIVTMTTVGFGDIVPVTVPGKILSSFLILVGYSLIIVPTGFVAAEVIESKRKKAVTTISCPSCVSEGHDRDARFCKYCGDRL